MTSEHVEKCRILLAAFALVAVAGCQHASHTQPPWVDVSISQMSPGKMAVLEQTYNLTLRVQNPNKYDIKADGLSFRIEANGKLFAKGVSNQPVLIPRLGEALVQVQAISDFSKIAAQINSAQTIRTEGLNYRLAGRVYSGNDEYFFDYRGQIADAP